MEGVLEGLPEQEREGKLEESRIYKLRLTSWLFWSFIVTCLAVSIFFLAWPKFGQYQEQKQTEAEEAVLVNEARGQALYFAQRVRAPWQGVIQPFCSDRVWVYADLDRREPIVKFCNIDHGEFTVTGTFVYKPDGLFSGETTFIKIAWQENSRGYQGFVDVTELVVTDGIEIFTFFIPKYGPDGKITSAAQEALKVWQKK